MRTVRIAVEEVATKLIQAKPRGHGFQITIPKREVAAPLGLKGKEKVRVFLDVKGGRILLELIR